MKNGGRGLVTVIMHVLESESPFQITARATSFQIFEQVRVLSPNTALDIF